MSRIIWKDELTTGIEDIDRQHRKILDFVYRLDQSQEDQIRTALLEIRSYLAFHFRFEEALLQEAGYPFLRAHKKVHELMTRRLAELHLRFKSGEDITSELNDLLSTWVYNHIQNDDAAYIYTVKTYLLATGKARSPTRWWTKIINTCLVAIGARH